jgi:outer membrane protein W
LWGATIGAGLDYKLHSRGILGVLVEGDWYANKNYDFTLANGNPSYAKITVKPLVLNIALTYKYKLG